MSVVSMSYLLEAGVHFGHQTKRWNPKMKEYIFTSRDGIYIIDLQKSAKMIEEAYEVLRDIIANNGKVLFVGTRKQAQEAIKEESLRVGMPYVTERWLGGTLTNFKTIRQRVKRLEEIETMEKDGTFEVLPKKEVIGLRKEYAKLNKVLEGIRDLHKLPEAMFIVDPTKEAIAIAEAKRLNIPVFGIVDTNCDPDMVDYIIPGNDDAIRSVKLIVAVMANAVAEAKGEQVIDFVTEQDKNTNGAQIMEKALETVKRPNDRPRRDFDQNDRRDFKKPFHRQDNEPKAFVKEEAEKNEVKEEVKSEVKAKTEEPKEVKPTIKVKTEEPKEVKAKTPVVKKEEKKKTEVKAKKEVKESKKDLNSLTVAELRELAKQKEIKGYSTMKKAELIEILK